MLFIYVVISYYSGEPGIPKIQTGKTFIDILAPLIREAAMRKEVEVYRAEYDSFEQKLSWKKCYPLGG